MKSPIFEAGVEGGLKTKVSIIPLPERRRSSMATTMPFSAVVGLVRLVSSPSRCSASPNTGSCRLLSRARFLAKVCGKEEMVRMAVERYVSIVSAGGIYADPDGK